MTRTRSMSVLSVMFEVRVTEVKQNSVKSVKRLSECLSGVKVHSWLSSGRVNPVTSFHWSLNFTLIKPTITWHIQTPRCCGWKHLWQCLGRTCNTKRRDKLADSLHNKHASCSTPLRLCSRRSFVRRAWRLLLSAVFSQGLCDHGCVDGMLCEGRRLRSGSGWCAAIRSAFLPVFFWCHHW